MLTFFSPADCQGPLIRPDAANHRLRLAWTKLSCSSLCDDRKVAVWSVKAWAAVLQSCAECSEACTALSRESRIVCTIVGRISTTPSDLDRDLRANCCGGGAGGDRDRVLLRRTLGGGSATLGGGSVGGWGSPLSLPPPLPVLGLSSLQWPLPLPLP